MKKVLLTLIIPLITTTLCFADPFTLSSPQIKDSTISIGQVYNGFGCTGKNISPELIWKNAPKGTKSYAITVFDLDAPTGSGWWHWMIYNIPNSTTSLPLDASNKSKKLPHGALQGLNDFGFHGFGGPCPPPGTNHRYIFTIYALKVSKLDVSPKAMPAEVGFYIHMNMIDKASFIATYRRSES